MKLKGEHKKPRCISVLLSHAMGDFPIGTELGHPKPRKLRPLLSPFVYLFFDTARLDIGKRFKKTNIIQTVPNVSSNVP